MQKFKCTNCNMPVSLLHKHTSQCSTPSHSSHSMTNNAQTLLKCAQSQNTFDQAQQATEVDHSMHSQVCTYVVPAHIPDMNSVQESTQSLFSDASLSGPTSCSQHGPFTQCYYCYKLHIPTVRRYTVHRPNQVSYNIPSCGPC